ncbi:MAG: extracellular solute-binding protein, partial [Desulfobacterales bacterium]|nr:extracellular solute-binding protein [Desulfobacterales bacterium]
QTLAAMKMEHMKKVTPTYDLVVNSEHVQEADEAGILEKVDWKPLLLKGTPSEVLNEVPSMSSGILTTTGYMGLMYNSDKIPAAEVPRSLSALANPKWKGKVAIPTSASSYTRWSYYLGREKVLADLRAIMKNEPIQGRYADELNRYLLGEVWMAFITSQFMKLAQVKGMPTAWQSLDFGELTDYSLTVSKGAAHPNAAKLLAVYLASPAGAKFTLEEAGGGNIYYPGNYEHDIRVQNRKQGIREISNTRDEKMLKLILSKEYRQWQKEIKLVLQSRH